MTYQRPKARRSSEVFRALRGVHLAALAALLGCSSGNGVAEPGPATGGNPSAGASAGGAPGAGGSPSGGDAGKTTAGAGAPTTNGGTSTAAGAGGSSTAGAAGSPSVNAGGAAGTAGAATAGSAGAGGTAAQTSFTCSEVLGLTLTKEWYMAGFEQGVVDTKWQLKAAQSAYVDEWAKSDSPFWATPLVSPCAASSTSPDRVVFVVLSWTIMAQADWEKAIGGAVTSIKTKYPNVGRIDLMTIIRGPGNSSCGDPNTYAENTHIPAALDAALVAVSAASPTLVRVAPQFAVDACTDYTGVGPHLTSAGNAKLAGKIAASFAP